jgi:hypothetical protein
MNELDQAIQAALNDPNQANHAYFKFLKAKVYLPCEPESDPEDPRVLFLESDNGIFLTIFSNEANLWDWAGEDKDKISSFEVLGLELVQGLGEKVTLALNPGQSSYKEFNPDEITKLKTMVAKIHSLGQS